MTPQTDPRQALITEIDTVLSKSQSRLPWVMAGEVTQQRRVLKRVRDYLESLSDRSSSKGQLPPGRSRSQSSRSPSRRRQSLLGAPLSDEANNGYRDSSLNQQIVQAVVQDMRSSVLAPLEAEIAALRDEREQMRQELRSLDLERRSGPMTGQSQAAMSEFFQTLIDRCAENLTQQVAQNLAQMQIDILQYKATPPHDPVLAPGDRPLLTPQERLEQLQAIQSQSDRLLKTLDASINVVFETLQSNLKSYSESMTQGVEHMYSLGQQGEVMFSALINQLASQLGREASSYIQSHAEEPTGGSLDPMAEKSLISAETTDLSEVNNAETSTIPEEITATQNWTPSDTEGSSDRLEAIDPPISEGVTTEETLVLEDLTLEIFNQLDDLANIDEDNPTAEPLASTETAAQLDERVAEANALYDNLFNSDRFISSDFLSLENDEDPLQELIIPSASALEPELQEMLESDEEGSGEEVSAIANDPESLESNLFDGLDMAVEEDPQIDEPDDSRAIESPSSGNLLGETDTQEPSPKLESALFEGASPPTQVDDPASLATFMELFGEDDAATESLQTPLISDAPFETDDIYIPASPDENLLPSNDETIEGVPNQLDLDNSVLNQLSQDLFSLEDELTPPRSELDPISEFPREADEDEDSSLVMELDTALDGMVGETLLPEISSPTPELIPDNPTPDNFLDDILSPPSETRDEPLPDRPVVDPTVAEVSPEPPASENLFEIFADEDGAGQSALSLPSSSAEQERENLALLLEPESEATLDLPESLTIDTVFEEPLSNSESSNLETDAPISSTADRPLEPTLHNDSPSPENPSASPPEGTATLENMFEEFLRGENSDLSDPSGNSLFSADQPTDTEQSFTLDDVFEDFTEE
ncbi:hypothetical protein PMH09_16110 [Roseofilum sp. BLCC_M143]|uniref:Uncharacterized protein n=1 Tax=Roseofilum casamattae BLCC-M143 TaxID=3022442 RepID=A0ABT7BZS6_9CYAN|nr:hypothetical protein [Roseofilum casamattae BLCC-M143]